MVYHCTNDRKLHTSNCSARASPFSKISSYWNPCSAPPCSAPPCSASPCSASPSHSRILRLIALWGKKVLQLWMNFADSSLYSVISCFVCLFVCLILRLLLFIFYLMFRHFLFVCPFVFVMLRGCLIICFFTTRMYFMIIDAYWFVYLGCWIILFAEAFCLLFIYLVS